MKRRSRTLRRRILLQHEKRLNSQGLRLIAGIDEAGRGPLAGPVVAGAVILKNFDFKEDIDDSKKLSPKKRERAYREILDHAIVGVGIIDEKTIDRINIYRATIRAMQEAVDNLMTKPEYVLVDGRMKLPTKCPIKCIVGGDSKSLSIAAASIVAKVTRDRIMVKYDSIYPQYGFARHKGYGTKFHMAALEEHGPSPIHRFSFHPVKGLAR
ncbi:MAG: ribonuclease HII [Candidatus Omnitrophica bacterium]|nr:ribonuclease HII [Candidatus Omnitrophota bacterium]